jgi:N-acetylglucosaminyl-diphospho-decaprenol L-rhamnosyltransferase
MTPSDPDVTIVIVAHSVRHELEACLGSIRDHAGDVATETILIDNASTDDTVAWVRAEHPEVTLIELDHNPGTGSRYLGIERARGRYTMIIDSDAYLTEGALPRMVEALDANPGWGLVGPKLVNPDGSLQLSCRRWPPLVLPIMRRPPLDRWLDDAPLVRHHLMADEDHDRTRPVLYVLGACQMFRSDLAARAGRFDTRSFIGPDDIDWCVRIRDAGGEIVYLPDAVVVHAYQRRSRQKIVSMVAVRHLRDFYGLQWRYRRRRREFVRLGKELDRRAAA